MLRYAEMTHGDIMALDRNRTLFAMVLSPLEVHGPHLPVGTDAMVSRGFMESTLERFGESHPDFRIVIMPDCALGSDPLPVPGSLGIPAVALESVLYSIGKGLADMGFGYLMIFDNHGGPRHQMAIASAVRRLWKRQRFHMMVPFLRVYRDMVGQSLELASATGLGPGSMGDDTDAHAGTNETSLYMDATGYRLPDPVPPPSPAPVGNAASRLLIRLGGIMRAMGAEGLGSDLLHLSRTLAWVGGCADQPYCGDPGKATAEAGRKMREYHVAVGLGMLERALEGLPPESRPLGWALRMARFF